MKTSINTDATTALEALDPVKYQATRNYIGGSTRLSVYITRGVLTLPHIKVYLSNKYPKNQLYKIINELAWREYWQREWMTRGEAIFNDIKTPQYGVESTDLPSSVITATTGITALDMGIRQLYDTGYIDNHMRMWLSGLICNIAHTKWQHAAKWMYYYLLDGDPASNTLSWQWIAGTFSSKQYLPSQENINTYTKSFQKGTIIDKNYEELATIKTPESLASRDRLELKWSAPSSSAVSIDLTKPTLLYHSFWLNSEWRKELDANRLLVLDPQWFAMFPVSAQVTKSITEIAQEIPDMQIYVGSIEELTQQLGKEVYYMSHPSVVNWPGQADQMPLLFPEIPLRSYNSFTSYWKLCEKFL